MQVPHYFFWSGPLSQWQRSDISLWGEEFVTAEQAMMFAKAQMFGDKQTAALILAAPKPDKQKALGRQVRRFDTAVWDTKKIALVTEINFAKFDQNKGLRRKLFQTGTAPLAEASPVDTIWGIGLDAKKASEIAPEDWPGQNLLGHILTDVRGRLRFAYPDEQVDVAYDT